MKLVNKSNLRETLEEIFQDYGFDDQTFSKENNEHVAFGSNCWSCPELQNAGRQACEIMNIKNTNFKQVTSP